MNTQFKDNLDSDGEQEAEYNICVLCESTYFTKPKYGLICPSGCGDIYEDMDMNGFAFH